MSFYPNLVTSINYYPLLTSVYLNRVVDGSICPMSRTRQKRRRRDNGPILYVQCTRKTSRYIGRTYETT